MVNRDFVIAVCLSALSLACGGTEVGEPRQATGVKVGEVTPTSAIVWTRITEKAERRADGVERRKRADRENPEMLNPSDLEGSVPGSEGRVRLRYGVNEDLSGAVETDWMSVSAEDDYTHHFKLDGLKPATVYHFESQTSSADGSMLDEALRGRFETAPPPEEYGDVTFTVVTGQAYKDVDDPNGFLIYPSMLKLHPKFIIPTGDTVYYDSDDPLVTSIDLARYHWHRIYSYPFLQEFHSQVPGYWEKDDHDSYANDNWPGLSRDYMGSFSFEQGLKVYAEQAPMSELPYRTFRWGKGLQIWVVEGRDFRSPNKLEDGPEKTIWGAEQKEWLKRTLLESDADWRVLISPTPIVGPDRGNKADNHANEAFQHEGDEFRGWVQENIADNFVVACGDRHWQYHSVHPTSGVQEYSCGPASDQHAGGTPGESKEYHRFHRPLGGFLSVTAKRVEDESRLVLRLHAVDGAVVYEQTQTKRLDGGQ